MFRLEHKAPSARPSLSPRSSGGGRHVRPLRLVHAVAHTGARPARAGPAVPYGLIAPCAGVRQELAKQADPNLTLDTEAQQARDHLAFRAARAACVGAALTRAHASQVLQDIAEDFVENVAAFACELVKHRALALTPTPAPTPAPAPAPTLTLTLTRSSTARARRSR